MIPRRKLHQLVFVAAGLYNLAWGLWTALEPQWLSRIAGFPMTEGDEGFAGLGLVVGLYGIVYLEVARVPERGWVPAAVGLAGKVVGSVGVLWLVLTSRWPSTTLMVTVTNDLVWWAPFSLYLRDTWRVFVRDLRTASWPHTTTAGRRRAGARTDEARLHDAVILVSALLLLTLTASCRGTDPSDGTPQTFASPTASPSPTMSPETEGLEAAFVPVAGFTFHEVPSSLSKAQLRAIRGSVRGVGKVTDSVVRSAEREDDMSVVVTLAAIKPNEGRTSMNLFAAILGDVSETGRVSRTLGGQAFLVAGENFEVVISPVAVEPQLLLLIAVGPLKAPVKEVAREMLLSLS
jgi:hypothetical protein